MQRFNIFRNNIETIRNHNELYKAGQTTYKMGLNQFGDMTTDEFHNQYLNNAFKSDKSDRRKNAVNMKLDERKPRVNDTLPGVIDWRAQGAVNPIKNQKSCGSCWAFSTVRNRFFCVIMNTYLINVILDWQFGKHKFPENRQTNQS